MHQTMKEMMSLNLLVEQGQREKKGLNENG